MAAFSGKMAYVTFPLTGDREIDLQEIILTCREIHTQTNIIPFSPIILPLMYLDSTNDVENELIKEFTQEFFDRGTFDELWITGNEITERMEEEVFMAIKMGIDIRCLNPRLQTHLEIIIDNIVG